MADKLKAGPFATAPTARCRSDQPTANLACETCSRQTCPRTVLEHWLLTQATKAAPAHQLHALQSPLRQCLHAKVIQPPWQIQEPLPHPPLQKSLQQRVADARQVSCVPPHSY